MKRNGILIIMLLLIMLQSCCNNRKEILFPSEYQIQFLQIADHSEGMMINVIDLLLCKSNQGSLYRYEYKNSENKCSTYYDIDFENYKGQYYDSKDTCILEYKSKQNYILHPKMQYIDVYQFTKSLPAVDDDFVFYFVPSIGLIMKRSTTWPVITHLYSDSGVTQNESLTLLISLVYMNMFYSKECENIPYTPPMILP